MSRLLPIQEGVEIVISPETPVIKYTPDAIDEYIVVVEDFSYWEEIHNYIIEENEIDDIPNRRITCINPQEHSLRTSIYLMSIEEAEVLKAHPKIEDVEINPEKYPQPQSLHTFRYKKIVGFNKPLLIGAIDAETTFHVNDVRSNWSHLFVNNPTSYPFRGVGIASTTFYTSDIQFSLTGRGVDAVIIDSGVAHLHPEFQKTDGTYRVKDVILDGPYKVDPVYFNNLGLTYIKVVDGVEIGVGIATTAAREWWTDSGSRSAEFSSIGTVNYISSSYTVPHVSTKTSNGNSNQLIDGHGTACASQIGGKSFGLAFECNIWNIRISLGDVGGIIAGSSALNICAIWHKAKLIAQNGNPNPTIINNSWGSNSTTGNTNGTSYSHGYRGSTLSYTGNGNNFIIPANAGACRNTKTFTYNIASSTATGYPGNGEYTPNDSSTNSAAENAIAAGCIVVTSAGNQNQKFADETDIDFNNWYSNSTNYVNRCGGVSKGFTGTHERKKGTIRIGALDCAVEPADSKQGATPYAIRKVCYSNSGPMINVWAPAEMTMAAGYTSEYENYQRQDNSNFYDVWFNGTSSASPNACSVIALYLESNRKATQADVHEWLDSQGSIEIDLSDPYPNPTDTGYWSQTPNDTFDASSNLNDSYNVRGNGSLRGAKKRVLHNPYANNTQPSVTGVNVSGILFSQT